MPKLNSIGSLYQYIWILKERRNKLLKVIQGVKIDKSNYKKVRLAYYLIISIDGRLAGLRIFLKENDKTLQPTKEFPHPNPLNYIENEYN